MGLRHFCETGCSVIHLMQRTVESEWRVQKCIIRGMPVPPRVNRLLKRRQKALQAQRMVLRGRASTLPNSFFRPALVMRWAPIFLAPAVFLLFWYSSLGIFRASPSIPVLTPSPPVSEKLAEIIPSEIDRPTIPTREVKPVVIPPSRSLEKPSEPIPPDIARHFPFPPGADLSRGPTWERRISLTFDGGAEANATEEILDILRSNGVVATMFLTGQYIRRYPDLVRRMIQDGHEIGNHTFSHPRLTTFAKNQRQDTLPEVNKEFVQRELREAARLFEQVTGRPMSPYWRAPYGEHNPEIRRWAAEIGYLHVGWTRDPGAGEDLDTRDWVEDPDSPLYYGAEQVRDRILNFGTGSAAQANGGIILLHLGTHRRHDRVHRELSAIIDGLRSQGYTFVPVSALHRDLALGEDGKGSAFAAER